MQTQRGCSISSHTNAIKACIVLARYLYHDQSKAGSRYLYHDQTMVGRAMLCPLPLDCNLALPPPMPCPSIYGMEVAQVLSQGAGHR